MDFKEISGQGGDVTIGGLTFSVLRWSVRKHFRNVPTTDTGCKGWARNARILAAWSFSADLITNANQQLDTSAVASGGVVPGGIETGTPAACTFKLGETSKAYTGNGLIEESSQSVDAQDVLHYQIMGMGTGPLAGPA